MQRATLAGYCPTAPPLALPARGTTWRVLAEWGEKHIFALDKEEGLGLFLFSRFWGKLSYMGEKIILYDCENYQQARQNLLLDNFPEVLYREKLLGFR